MTFVFVVLVGLQSNDSLDYSWIICDSLQSFYDFSRI